MNAELSDLLRAAVRDEASAAVRDFPLAADEVGGFARSVGRRRAAWSVAVTTACAVAVGGVAFGAVQLWQGDEADPVTPPSVTWSASSTPTATETSPGPTPSPSSTPIVTPGAAATAPATTPAVVTPDPPLVVAVPGHVSAVSAGPGGGSGEVVVNWGAVDGATGYRVYRSSAMGGPFDPAASVVASTGATTVELGIAYEYIQIWKPSSASFEYVEVVNGAPAYFTVTAFNSAGSGDGSPVVCGAPSGSTVDC